MWEYYTLYNGIKCKVCVHVLGTWIRVMSFGVWIKDQIQEKLQWKIWEIEQLIQRGEGYRKYDQGILKLDDNKNESTKRRAGCWFTGSFTDSTNNNLHVEAPLQVWGVLHRKAKSLLRLCEGRQTNLKNKYMLCQGSFMEGKISGDGC